jgi:hypothetical protein
MKLKSMIHICCAFASLSIVITIAAQARAGIIINQQNQEECDIEFTPIGSNKTFPSGNTYPNDVPYTCDAQCYSDDYESCTPHDWVSYLVTGQWSATGWAQSQSYNVDNPYYINGVVSTGDEAFTSVYVLCSDGDWYLNSCVSPGESGKAQAITCFTSCPNEQTATEVDVNGGLLLED